MKKLLAFIMAWVLVVSLTACSGNVSENTADTSTSTGTTETPAISTDGTDATSETTDNTTGENNTEETTGETETTPNGAESTPTESTPDSTTETTTDGTKPTEGTTSGTDYKDEPGEATTGHEHEYKSSITAPTCENGGYTTHTCSCGDVYVTDKTNATGHKFGDWVTVEESTTLKNGKAERKCAVCGNTETKTLDKLPIFHSHSYTDKVIAPTCTAKGYTVHTCSCGDSYIDSETDKIPHNYSQKVTKPTCTTEGYTTYTCSCGDSYIGNKTAKTAHNYSDTVTPPTCTAQGYTTHKCKDCKGSTIDTYVPAKGHSYASTVVNPTCTEGGYTTYKCTACGDSYNGNNTAATGHSYNETVVAPTCTRGGYTTYTCSKCNHSYNGNETAAAGHGETKVVNTATCTTDGEKQTICTVCSAILAREAVKANGQHTWEWRNEAETAKALQNGNLMDPDVFEAPKHTMYTEWLISVCSTCGDVDWGNYKDMYSDYEAAAIMLGYVNELRRDVLGSANYDLEISSTLLAFSKKRAQEIVTNYSHDGHGYYGENIAQNSITIYGDFVSWCNSRGHYATMVRDNYYTFGYARYRVGAIVFSVQIFHTQ